MLAAIQQGMGRPQPHSWSFAAKCIQVVVKTSSGRTIMAKRLGLTVGAWTNDVTAHLGLQFPLEIWKVHWGHYHVDPAVKDSMPQWYKFGKLQPDSWDEGLYYGFPPEGPEAIVKARAPPGMI